MQYPFIKQQSDWDCSLACIFMLADYYHEPKINYFQFIKKYDYFQDLNLIQMQKIASKLGIFLSPYFVKWNDFLDQKIVDPLICQVQKDNQFHFIVIYKKSKNHLLVANPWKEKVDWIKIVDFKKIYMGVVLTSQKTIYLEGEDQVTKVSFVFWNKLVFELIISFLVAVLLASFVILNQFLLKVIIDEVLIKQISTAMTTILFGFIILFLNKLILQIILNIVVSKIEINFKKNWNLKFFSQVSQLSFVNYQKYKTHLLLQNYKYFNEVLHFYFPVTFQILESCFIVLFSFFILMMVNITIVLPVIFLVSLNLIIYFLLLPWFKKVNQQQINSDKQIQQQIIDFFHNYLSYRNRNHLYIPLNQIQTKLNNQVQIWQKKTKLVNVETVINQMFSFFTTIVAVYLLLNFNKAQLIKPGSFVFLFALINNLVSKSSWFFSHFIYWVRLKEPKKQVDAFLFPKTNSITSNLEGLFLKQIKTIELKNVNFSYDQNTSLWKDNLNLQIKNNMVIYGHSGIGKTTFLQMLNNNLSCHKGMILINNKSLQKEINSDFYQKHTYFLQGTDPISTGTVLNNIVDWDRRNKFLTIWKEANIDYFCQKINLNPTSWVSDQTVSNGQRQIINFLALFFCTQQIILLDESLNSVNLIWKKELLNKLLQIKKDSFIFYATHDPMIKDLFKQELYLIANED